MKLTFKWKFWRFAFSKDRHEKDNPGSRVSIKEANGARWIYLRLGVWFLKSRHEHEKETFCVGNIAFVKCLICGDESMPWPVSDKVAQAWKESHADRLERLYKFDKDKR